MTTTRVYKTGPIQKNNRDYTKNVNLGILLKKHITKKGNVIKQEGIAIKYVIDLHSNLTKRKT